MNRAAHPGDTFSLQVRGESFTDFVVGGGLNLGLDAASLRLDCVMIDTTVWEFAPGGSVIDNTGGTLGDAFFNTFAAVQPTNNFLAATLNFTATATGAGNSVVALQTSPFFPFVNANTEVIAVSLGSANVSVTAVPEPASWASLERGVDLGLALLPMLRRRLVGT